MNHILYVLTGQFWYRVLIVEDNKTLSKLYKRKIEARLDYIVDTASTYQEAVNLINKSETDYVTGVLDLNLPDAPNGEIVDFVLSRNIPVIVVTGDFTDIARGKIWSKKVVDYVLKEGMHNLEYVISLIDRIARNKSTKVLVVDDSEISRIFVSELLKIHKYVVYEAASAEEAISILKRNPDIKLMITDYVMKEMDGLELTEKIRYKYSKEKLAIIGISAQTTRQVSNNFIKMGANDFLTKPFSKEEFYCRVIQNIKMIEHFEAIKESEERFRLVFENASDGILVVNSDDGDFISANKKMIDLIGFSGKIYSNRSKKTFSNKFKNQISDFLMQIEGKKNTTNEILINFDSCICFYAEFETTSMILNGRNCSVYMVRDITERKYAEKERLQNEKLQGVFELAGATCHEFNQPLQVIVGYLQLIQNAENMDKNLAQYSKIIKDQTVRLADITKKLQNITCYETKDYLTGKIIDIDKASGKN